MCFGGGRDDGSEDRAPRPAQQIEGPEGKKAKGERGATSSAVPAYRVNDYAAPPPGPPPSQRRHQEQKEYAPPAGPPPRHHQNWAAPPPPPEAPPSREQARQAHDWEAAIPDTSLFPPPPALFSGHVTSPTNNASEAEAEAGEEWCTQHPLAPPMVVDATAKRALEAGNIRLVEPAGFSGELRWLGPGRWRVATEKKSPDRCIIGYPPLYLANEHGPTRPDGGSSSSKTIYYEVKLLVGSGSNSVAVGFTALPYPSFRLPGWHRGSLAVHGDDGRRYVNDRWGGRDLTGEFRGGETLGVGMTFGPAEVAIFFTRDGVRTGGWDLHEETDAEEDLPVTGLEGFHDLSCAIGTFDHVEMEVVFDAARWMYRPT